MIDHCSIAVGSIGAAEPFYDAVFAALGIAKVSRDEGWLGYGARADADHPERVYVSIRTGSGGDEPSRHWAFKAIDRAAVRAFHEAGLASGGRDDGAPGVRAHYHAEYFAAFLIDPAGNRIEAVCHSRQG
jgi:catechol 2,3-dioxygenase-like lactoylglutathione lyase family enzyme